MNRGWEEEGPKFAHMFRQAPLGEEKPYYLVRVYVRGEWCTNVPFRSFLIAKLFAILLDLSMMHSTTQKGRR